MSIGCAAGMHVSRHGKSLAERRYRSSAVAAVCLGLAKPLQVVKGTDMMDKIVPKRSHAPKKSAKSKKDIQSNHAGRRL